MDHDARKADEPVTGTLTEGEREALLDSLPEASICECSMGAHITYEPGGSAKMLAAVERILLDRARPADEDRLRTAIEALADAADIDASFHDDPEATVSTRLLHAALAITEQRPPCTNEFCDHDHAAMREVRAVLAAHPAKDPS